jgi:folate-binding protein YgfZ
LDPPCFFQNLQVLGDGGLGERQPVHQVSADAIAPRQQEPHDGHAGRMSERLREAGGFFVDAVHVISPFIVNRKYTIKEAVCQEGILRSGRIGRMPTPRLDSIATDYRVLRDSAGVTDLSSWTSFRITGPDARAFVQGLATQDLDAPAVAAPAAAPTLFLSERGRPVAFAWVSIEPRSGSVGVVADDAARVTLRPHFERFRVMEEVEIVGPRDTWIFGFAGPERSALLSRFIREAGMGTAEDPDRDLEVFEGDPLSFAVLPKASAVPPGFDLTAPEAFEAWRVAAGLPCKGDLDPDRIATELNLDLAISHTKGCFVGQEVVSRTSNRGQVKRSRLGFRFPAGALPADPRAELRFRGATAGYVTSSVVEPGTGAGLGMGYLTHEARLGGSVAVVLPDGSEAPIEIHSWPL